MAFSEVFDKVSHSLLVHKLHCYGIAGKVNAWIESFLADRKQSIVVNGARSEPAPVDSGETPRLCSWSKSVSFTHQQLADRTVINIKTLGLRYHLPQSDLYPRPTTSPTRPQQASIKGITTENVIPPQKVLHTTHDAPS